MDSQVYGRCGRCAKFLPRDEMRSASIHIYGGGVGNREDRIPIRLCPDCWGHMIDEWQAMRWTKRLFSKDEIECSQERPK